MSSAACRPGEYVACTSTSAGYVNEIHNDIPCATTCAATTAVATGTPIVVAGAPFGAALASGASLTAGIDFHLNARTDVPGPPAGLRVSADGFSVQFSWTAPSLSTGGAATSYVIEAGVSPGGTTVSLPATGTSHVVNGAPAGTFYVRVRGVNAAGTGAPSAEVVLRIGTTGSAPLEPPTNVAAFMSGGLLTLTWSAPASGSTPTGYVVEAGSATGLANVASVLVAGRSFVFQPVPNGFYFLRVRARNAAGTGPASEERMIVIGGVASPPGPPTFSSTSVTGSTVTLFWSAPTIGTPTSYRVEAGSAPDLSDLAVANTNSAALSVSFSGVPPGTYYVRLRAVNALGASIVSNERTLVVP